METRSKKRMRSRVDDDSFVEIDRISSLPDSLLQHMLSFIPTKDAASTSILSTSWKNTWTGTPVVNIELDSTMKNMSQERKQHFMNFMDRLLLLHNGSNIDKFRLSFWPSFDSDRVTSWISTLLRQHKVKDLILYFIVEKQSFVLPSSIFTCESLTRLRIMVQKKAQISFSPSTVCLLYLKHLYLRNVTFSCEKMTQEAVFTFPKLDDCTIWHCQWVNTKVVRICAPRLRRLIISDAQMGDYCEVNVCAPNVISFEFIGSLLVPKYSLCNLSSISNATIKFHCVARIEQYIIKFLRAISKAKNLRVDAGTITDLCSLVNSFHSFTFPNLSTLNITGLDQFDLRPEYFIRFLNLLPHLESLHFEDGIGNFCKKENDGMLADRLSCVLSQMKAIEVESFDGKKQDLFLIELFLKKAISLERMIIRFSEKLRNQKKLANVSRQLEKLRRGSVCVIDFS